MSHPSCCWSPTSHLKTTLSPFCITEKDLLPAAGRLRGDLIMKFSADTILRKQQMQFEAS
jgi:hypothetical protein